MLLELEGVYQAYERKGTIEVLHDIHLSMDEGEFVCVLGPSGCGKSTLLRIIAGIEPPVQGTVRCNGHAVRRPDRERGVVFQQPALYPWLTIEGNIEFGLKMRHMPKADRREVARRYLELVGLEEFRDRKPYELSGGMKQRAAIARVLANDPSIILMDEPFGALDAFTKEQMQDALRQIWRATGKTIFFITHDVEEALALGTRIVVMSPRPAVIHADLPCSFTHAMGEGSRTVRASQAFIEQRETLVNMIHQMHAT
ncbi:ABC transporter ATP-binding protein [Alicyclobacillus cycloheptanicus]|uniref:ABC-type nitrate/sulfonate/bicarbonate transport system ATPase subunit n=1 Tax=Alicyclobacillus cycloheptanicus TaxID=1457 RepID=A0ABT9XJ78_9BACL|nr:ABC transporter ATP-binding protein [Alicyclobacillus cycloheptanicus]MDQ0190335.1 ABC-type nitrate/sulfonate/bicarbonate transport system ATPase subunit [Alicyclobacillus cycloheptanicus]WDM00023.1 ABC transporter ATP-binding protein [Alicyclobacillus cycloheptanicus]